MDMLFQEKCIYISKHLLKLVHQEFEFLVIIRSVNVILVINQLIYHSIHS